MQNLDNAKLNNGCELSASEFKKLMDRLTDIDIFTKDELHDMVFHDNVIHSYNWNYLWQFLRYSKEREVVNYSFVYFDIKDFKSINEIYSTLHANDLLHLIADTLSNEEEWILCAVRSDNDNFALITKDISEEELIQKLYAFFDKVSYLPCDPDYKVYYRAGVVMGQEAKKYLHDVGNYAKYAQRQCQAHAKTEVKVYTDEQFQNYLVGKKYLSRLDEAIANDEFVVYLQPKYDIQTEKITGAEALVRWNYEHRKMLFPGDFIPVFESNDVIGKVDQVVLENVCRILSYMREEGLPLHTVSVNLSRRRIDNNTLKKQLIDCVDKYNIPHELIEFELTESSSYSDMDSLFKFLEELREEGFLVSMDDFGTGYSSINLLLNMPMDTLKIDKCFVDSILEHDEDSRECMLVRDIISIAKHMGFCCIAEGAEEQKQINFLRKYGCDQVQGYYYSKPVPEEDYIEKIKKDR